MKPSRQSPNTCSTCRARKVRCDGRKDICGNCERLKFPCSYDTNPNEPKARRAIVRRRAHSACLACHARRIRCNEAKPNCQRCSKLGLECSYPGIEKQGGTGEMPAGSMSLGTASPNVDPRNSAPPELEVPQELAMLAFQVFFDKLHRIPVFAFLHKACIIEQYRNSLLDRALLLSLVGITSLLEDLGEGTRDRSEKLIDEAASIIVNEMEKPTVPRIQALILIVKYRALTKRFASVFMLSAVAVRFATGLRLNYEDTQLTFLARESCRRTMWSLYLIDSTLAAGYQDFALSLSGMIHINFPCHERNFDLDLPPDDAADHGGESPLALILRLAQLRHRTLQFTKQAVERQTSTNDVVEGIQGCQRELDSFLESLPPAYKLSKHNIMLHAYSSTLSVFVSLHATWHGIVCILHRLVVDGLVESLPPETIAQLESDFKRTSERKCFESPKAVTDMLQSVQSAHVDSITLDLDIAVCIYQCLRVMIRSYRTNASDVNDTIDSVNSRCQCGLEFLQSMFANTPAVKAIIDDTENLIREEIYCQGTERTQETQMAPRASTRSQRSHHVLSKHSLIGQIDMPSKEKSFLLSPSETGAQAVSHAKSPDFGQGATGSESTARSTMREHQHTQSAPTIPDLAADSHALEDWETQEIDTSLYQLPDLGLPDFGLDSSIFLPSDWMRGMPSEF